MHANSGDNAWMLTSTVLVLLMTIPGLALFYGGMVRTKNVGPGADAASLSRCLVTMIWADLHLQPGLHAAARPFIGGLDQPSCRAS